MRFIPASSTHRLMMFVCMLSLLVGVPTYVYIEQVFKARLIADRGSALRDVAVSAASLLTERLAERQRDVMLLALSPELRNDPGNTVTSTAALQRLQKSYSPYIWLSLADESGVVTASTSSFLTGEQVADRSWFAGGMQTSFFGGVSDATQISKAWTQQVGKFDARYVSLSAPVKSDAGKIGGVVLAVVTWKDLSGVIAQTRDPRLSADQLDVFVANNANTLLYPDSGNAALKAPPVAVPAQEYFVDDWAGDMPYITATAPVILPAQNASPTLRVVVRQPLPYVLAPITTLQRVLLLATLTMVAIMLLVIAVSAAIVGRPIRALTELTQRMNTGDERVKIEIQSPSHEMRELVESIRNLVSTMINRKQELAASNARLEQKVADQTAALVQATEGAQRLVRHDALTRLPNRMAANERLTLEFVRMKRSKIPYAVALIEIKGFKKTNEHYGYDVCDQLLRHVAGIVKTCVRESDFISRFGDSSFLAVLIGSNLAGAMAVIDRCHKAVQAIPDPVVGKITLNIGVAEATPYHTDEHVAAQIARSLIES